jgi:adenylate cyclase
VELWWTQAEQDQIRASVASMLSSSLFAGSPRQQRFLEYLVTNTLAGDANRLKGYTIAVEVFDRKEDFDPSLDAIVRVEATRLRNKLREYYDTLGKSDSIRIDFPKGGYVLEMRTHSLPEGERNVTSQEQASNAPRLIRDKPSLAVLPFMNISADNQKEYFADGVVDSLIAMFSRLSGLFVISRQSSFAYKNTAKTSKEIATELGVRYLLEGSIQHAGGQVRITAQLVDAHDGGQVWSERYDRELKDIFALQDELTQNIVRVLQIKLAGEETLQFGIQQTNSIEAHDYLLQAIAAHRKYSEKPTYEAIALYQKALALDPNYTAAHAWLARSLSLSWSQRWNLDVNVLDKALFHAVRATELDPQSPYAMSILGWVQLWCRSRDEGIANCRRAIALDHNNAEGHLFLSIALSAAGLGDEALYYVEKAQRLSPIPDPFYLYTHAMSLYVLKNYQKAVAIFEQGCHLNDNFLPNHVFQMYAYEQLGMQDKVRDKYEKVIALRHGDRSMPTVVFWTDQALADAQVEIWERVSARHR